MNMSTIILILSILIILMIFSTSKAMQIITIIVWFVSMLVVIE